MKSIYLLPFCLLLALTAGAQTKSAATQTKKESSKKYDKVEKAYPLTFKLKNSSIGFAIGSATYMGDLQDKSITWKQSKLGGGICLHNYLNEHIAVRFMLNVAQLGASDANSSSKDLQSRNLSFRTTIVELGAVGEYHFLIRKSNKADGTKQYAKVAPYLFGGVALFHFNPQTEYNGEWVDLKPLHTEGQNFGHAKEYKLTQIALPIGVGINYNATARVAFSIELGARKTFTDYIDDVSTTYPSQALMLQNNGPVAAELSYRYDEYYGSNKYNAGNGGNIRGRSENNDWYVMSTVGVRYKLK